MYATHLATIDCPLMNSTTLDRTQKLKDARSEAAKELEAHQAKKEAELKEFEAKVR